VDVIREAEEGEGPVDEMRQQHGGQLFVCSNKVLSGIAARREKDARSPLKGRFPHGPFMQQRGPGHPDSLPVFALYSPFHRTLLYPLKDAEAQARKQDHPRPALLEVQLVLHPESI
jgi:hypothetical protein